MACDTDKIKPFLMKKFNPVIKIKSIATEHSIRLSDNVVAKTARMNTFLTGVADVFLIYKEYHKRNIFPEL